MRFINFIFLNIPYVYEYKYNNFQDALVKFSFTLTSIQFLSKSKISINAFYSIL